jgi:hypothetical protein
LPVHAARGTGWSSTAGRVLGRVLIGPLAGQLPPGLVDEVLAECGAVQRRFRLLPSRLGVYFVLGLCLFRGLGYPAVLGELMGGLEGQLAGAGWGCPSPTALSRLRGRLGEAPSAALLGRLASPLAAAGGPGSRVCGLLAVGWDGTLLEVPASAANVAALGRQRGTHYPQVRLVALVACGTRAVLGAALGAAAERELAGELLGVLGKGMLLLADRGFFSFDLWHRAAGTGADLLWRVKGGLHLRPVRVLPDGSCLSVLPSPGQAHRAANRRYYRKSSARPRRRVRPRPVTGTTVRVIAFTLAITGSDGKSRAGSYYLLTTLLDPVAAPAAELAAAYARRWAVETAFAELKTYLRGGPGTVLRSGDPAGVRQELWAFLVIYQAIRIVICAAAAGAGLDPGRVSFTTALHAIRHHTRRDDPAAALAAVEATILDPRSLVRIRPGRAYPRLTRRAAPSPPHSGPATAAPLPRRQACVITITPPGQATRTSTDQPRQPRKHPEASP